MRDEKIHLSTVTPVYQGSGFLRDLVGTLIALKADLAERQIPVDLTEAIFVDDESVDESAATLAELAEQYPWVRVVTLSRNFGQHSATIAGILHSSGDWVATLDEDLQHPPERLPSMLMHGVESSKDVVYASPEGAVHRSFFRDLSSRATKALLSRLSNNPNVRYFNSFRMIRGTVARAAASVASHDTYFDVALCWFTSRIGAVKMPLTDRREAAGQKSGYRLHSLLRHGRRLLITSEIKLLRFGALAGILSVFASLVVGLLIIAWKLYQPSSIEVRGWASTIVVIVFYGGLSSFLLGIVLEFMSVILLRAQGKPTFLAIDRGKDDLMQPWLERQSKG